MKNLIVILSMVALVGCVPAATAPAEGEPPCLGCDQIDGPNLIGRWYILPNLLEADVTVHTFRLGNGEGEYIGTLCLRQSDDTIYRYTLTGDTLTLLESWGEVRMVR